jgi:hypothetical protein
VSAALAVPAAFSRAALAANATAARTLTVLIARSVRGRLARVTVRNPGYHATVGRT